MVSVRDVLILGNFRGASRSALTTATNSLRLNVVEFTGVDEAIAALEAQPWHAILVDTTLSGASRFCAEARAVRSLFDVPLIALSPRLTDLAFLNALRWGADDVVALGAAEPLAVRLAALFGGPQAAPSVRGRGTAVVADPDRRRGDGLGRALHLAGYNVKYANDPVSARYYLAKSDTDLYVLNAELAEPVTLLGASENAATCRCVVLAKPTQLVDLEQQFRGNRNVVVMSSGGPPENVLFAVNLLFPNEASKRGETRALFGTVVFFRAVGDYRDECGFSYTASPQGIYVRTLAPAPTDKVWVELIPPDGERRVRLVGRVAWSRPFGAPAGEAAPPGFGVRIVDGLGEDLSLWSACLRSLEFRAPATLVPEARFSTPMSRLSSPDDLRPYVSAPLEAHTKAAAAAAGESREFDGDPRQSSDAKPSAPVAMVTTESGTSAPTQDTSASTGDPVVTSASPAIGVGTKTGESVNLSSPPTSLPLSRLRGPANHVTTRPSLRLSVPGPTSGKRDSLLRSGRLSRPPNDGPNATEPVAVPSRPGQGQTVLGLGLLKRDGSAADKLQPPADPPPKPSELPNPSVEENKRRSLEPYIVSPVTGRTLNYGSDTPAPVPERPTFPANEWDDDTTRTNLVDDISDRPTWTDRLSSNSAANSGALTNGTVHTSATHNSTPTGSARGGEREPFITNAATTPSSVAPTSPDVLDSLPPEALESDAPQADPESSARAPLLRRDPVARTYFGEPQSTTNAADTDEELVGLDRNSEDLFIAAERELESATRASIPAGGTLPGLATPPSPVVAQKRTKPHSGELAPDTDPEAPLATVDTDPYLADFPPSEQSPFEPALVTPLPPTQTISELGATQTITAAPPTPRRAVWFVVAAALCAALVLIVLVRRTQVRVARNVDRITAQEKVSAEGVSANATPSAAIAEENDVNLSLPALTSTASAWGESSNATLAFATSTSPGVSSSDPSTGVSTFTNRASPVASGAPANDTQAEPKSDALQNVPPQAVPSEHTGPTTIPQVTSPPPKDPQALGAKSAWLYVRSDVDARVFVHGVDSGVTNTWIETPCGTRFIRLGRALGDWLGQGFATVIRCRNSNIVDGVAK